MPQRVRIIGVPKIQEEIILQDNKLIASIPEYKLRSIFDELNWEKQCAQWQALKDTSLKSA